jgi:hypothetical protein
MNRSTGIVYLRPFVGSLSAIVAAILLCAANHADAHSPPRVGIVYLKNSGEARDLIQNWDPALVPTPTLTATSSPTTTPRVIPSLARTGMTSSPATTTAITRSARRTLTANSIATPSPSLSPRSHPTPRPQVTPAARPQALPGIGIMYLTNADAIGNPIHHWTTNDPPFTNPYTQGVVLRTQWGRVEPHEHANADDF